jgi:hypothetical protein
MAFFYAAPDRFLTLETTMTEPTTPQPKKRRLSADEKWRIYQECQKPDDHIGEILRRNGMYSSVLFTALKKSELGVSVACPAAAGSSCSTFICEDSRY